MKRTFVAALVATALALPGIAAAQELRWGQPGWGQGGNGQGGWGQGGQGGWGQGGWGQGGWGQGGWGQTNNPSVRLDQEVRNRDLPLRDLLNLGPQYDGQRLRSIQLRIDPGRSNGDLVLLLDGQRSSEQGDERRTVTFDLRGNNVIGRDFRRLQLAVDGRVYIESITAEVEGRGQASNCAPLDVDLDTRLRNERVDLDSRFDLGRYQGCRLEAVVVVGTGLNREAAAELVVDGRSGGVSHDLTRSPDRYRFDLPGRMVVGRDFNDLKLDIDGRADINTVRLVLR